MSRGVSTPAYSGTERFGINPVASTSQSKRYPVPVLLERSTSVSRLAFWKTGLSVLHLKNQEIEMGGIIARKLLEAKWGWHFFVKATKGLIFAF
jgi:hypothetical protein